MVHRHSDAVSVVVLIVPGGSPSSDLTRLPAHEVLVSDRSLRQEMSEEEAARFDSFYVVQCRDILEKARRSKYAAKALGDPE